MANSADPDKKTTDLDLHYLQRQGISGFSRNGIKQFYSREISPLSPNTVLKSKALQTERKQKAKRAAIEDDDLSPSITI